MRIKSKKTGMEQIISSSEWEQMKSTGDSLNFNVISRTDEKTDKPKAMPSVKVTEHINAIKEATEKQNKTIKKQSKNDN